jgi:hypothetical protein
MGRKKKKQEEKVKEFIVYSDLGYFKGLVNGGQLDWTQNESEAKPLYHPNQVQTIKFLAPRGIEVIFEYI